MVSDVCFLSLCSASVLTVLFFVFLGFVFFFNTRTQKEKKKIHKENNGEETPTFQSLQIGSALERSCVARPFTSLPLPLLRTCPQSVDQPEVTAEVLIRFF